MEINSEIMPNVYVCRLLDRFNWLISFFFPVQPKENLRITNKYTKSAKVMTRAWVFYRDLSLTLSLWEFRLCGCVRNCTSLSVNNFVLNDSCIVVFKMSFQKKSSKLRTYGQLNSTIQSIFSTTWKSFNMFFRYIKIKNCYHLSLQNKLPLSVLFWLATLCICTEPKCYARIFGKYQNDVSYRISIEFSNFIVNQTFSLCLIFFCLNNTYDL